MHPVVPDYWAAPLSERRFVHRVACRPIDIDTCGHLRGFRPLRANRRSAVTKRFGPVRAEITRDFPLMSGSAPCHSGFASLLRPLVTSMPTTAGGAYVPISNVATFNLADGSINQLFSSVGILVNQKNANRHNRGWLCCVAINFAAIATANIMSHSSTDQLSSPHPYPFPRAACRDGVACKGGGC